MKNKLNVWKITFPLLLKVATILIIRNNYENVQNKKESSIVLNVTNK
jgi:hypothetical protein